MTGKGDWAGLGERDGDGKVMVVELGKGIGRGRRPLGSLIDCCISSGKT